MFEWLKKMLYPQNVIWIVIILILIIGKCGFKLNYISVLDIIKNHLKCFKNSKNKIMIIPIANYIAIPFLLGVATTMAKKVDGDTIEIITLIISILTAMLFTLLAMIVDMKAKIKEDPNYFSTEAEISKKALLETYYTVMFEILVSVVLLILCFFNCFTQAFGNIQSFMIYSLTYMLVINLLMIIKRIFRVIDTDMRK